MNKMILFIIILSAILLVGCEEQRSTIIFGGERVCSEEDVYCHLVRSDSEQVNITFDSVSDDVFNYTVE